MKKVASPEAYTINLDGEWKVIVPVHGKLSPRVIDLGFKEKDEALAWLVSQQGQEAIAKSQGRGA